ncbi:MAG: hypothetical protein KY395_02110 [Actinobacteria bacterium]|nr:hypothetical protein [Actinomycetota bacterium]
MIKPTRHALALALTAVVLGATACGGDTGSPAAEGSEDNQLVGLFRIAAGACEGTELQGSYFRMVQPGGTLDDGPFVANGDSACADQTVTPMTPGSDGGLRTGVFQAQPEPAFDAAGNSLSGQIVQPQKWFAVAFGLATNPTDPQAEVAAAAPQIRADGTELTGNLESLAASWNGQHFNQGSPKPGGARPGLTAGPSGTYDSATGNYTLEWSSQIVGGPFSNFTGIWHLEGTFEPGTADQEDS